MNQALRERFYSPGNKKHIDYVVRISGMSDQELADFFREIYEAGIDDATSYGWGVRQNSFIWDDGWLQQPSEEV